MRAYHTFRTRMAPWVALLMVGLALWFVLLPLLQPEAPRGATLAGAGVILLFLALFWSTRYCVGPEGILIRLGPLRLHYPYSRLVCIRRGGLGEQVSRPRRLRLAASHHNLVLVLSSGLMREVVISPSDTEAFLQAVKAYAPDLPVER